MYVGLGFRCMWGWVSDVCGVGFQTHSSSAQPAVMRDKGSLPTTRHNQTCTKQRLPVCIAVLRVVLPLPGKLSRSRHCSSSHPRAALRQYNFTSGERPCTMPADPACRSTVFSTAAVAAAASKFKHATLTCCCTLLDQTRSNTKVEEAMLQSHHMQVITAQCVCTCGVGPWSVVVVSCQQHILLYITAFNKN
jgi:hypothetical protein